MTEALLDLFIAAAVLSLKALVHLPAISLIVFVIVRVARIAWGNS